ncbi:MAG: hypothetical protein H0W53_15930 [Acidobacteria bacterium]|nr:hypothetical protein [Acidobacteriota bacterium]
MDVRANPWMIGMGAGILSLATACATSTGAHLPTGAQAPSLPIYEPLGIIVGTRNTGTFRVVGGCIVFERVRPANSRSPALFPPGSTWIDASTAIRLPDGQPIPIGRTIEIAYEAPPGDRGKVPGCAGDPIYILNVVDKE